MTWEHTFFTRNLCIVWNAATMFRSIGLILVISWNTCNKLINWNLCRNKLQNAYPIWQPLNKVWWSNLLRFSTFLGKSTHEMIGYSWIWYIIARIFDVFLGFCCGYIGKSWLFDRKFIWSRSIDYLYQNVNTVRCDWWRHLLLTNI